MSETNITINITKDGDEAPIEQATQPETPATKIKAETPGEPNAFAVKLLSQTDDVAIFGGYGVIFGGVDLDGDTFTAETNFDLDYVPVKRVYIDHTLDSYLAVDDEIVHLKNIDDAVGEVLEVTPDDVGLYIRYMVEKANQYWEIVNAMYKTGKMGLSSGAISHLVRRKGNVIKNWPVVEWSMTVQPAESRTVNVERIKQLAQQNPELEALLLTDGIGDAVDASQEDESASADKAAGDAAKHKSIETQPIHHEVIDMADETKKTEQAPAVEPKTEPAFDAAAFKSELLADIRDMLPVVKAETASEVKITKDAGDRPFASFGEQLKAIATASMPGGGLDKRLLAIKAASGLNEGVPSEGAFLVQQDFATEIFSQAFAQSEILNRVRSIPIGANSNGTKITMIDETSRANGSRWGGVLGYWAAEAGTVTATNPTFRQISLDLKKLFGLAYATEENLMDAAQLETIIGDAFREELTFKAEDGVINGSGAGQPLGVLNSGCLVAVAKESGQAADSIVVENIDKMWSRLHPRFKKNAAWYVNPDTWPQLASLSRDVGTGGSTAFMPANGVSGNPYVTLYGRPIIETEYNATVGDKGDIMLADLSQYYLAQKGGQRAESSMHVRFLYDEMTFRVIWRLDGQPRFASALTPYKGSNTLSPFVVIAARA